MTIHRDPEKLDIYYCNSCGAILATTDIEESSSLASDQCPSCFTDSLSFVPRECYRDDLLLAYIYEPQLPIFKKMVQFADNVSDFLSAFQPIYKSGWLNLKLDRAWGFNFIEVMVEISLEVTLKVQMTDGTLLRITKEEKNLLDKLNISS